MSRRRKNGQNDRNKQYRQADPRQRYPAHVPGPARTGVDDLARHASLLL
jgi:hypothetical protein